MKLAGFDIQGRVIVRPGAFFTTSNVRMADEVFIQNGARLVSQGGITFGRRSGISYGTMLITQTHEIRGPGQRWSHEVHTAPITIGEGVWIGAGVVIGPGVTVGDGCIIAAGAVVMRDCKPHGLYIGNPARRIQELPMEDPGPGALADLGYTPVMPPRDHVG
jgi:maltose O-acetyltransferase